MVRLIDNKRYDIRIRHRILYTLLGYTALIIYLSYNTPQFLLSIISFIVLLFLESAIEAHGTTYQGRAIFILYQVLAYTASLSLSHTLILETIFIVTAILLFFEYTVFNSVLRDNSLGRVIFISIIGALFSLWTFASYDFIILDIIIFLLIGMSDTIDKWDVYDS